MCPKLRFDGCRIEENIDRRQKTKHIEAVDFISWETTNSGSIKFLFPFYNVIIILQHILRMKYVREYLNCAQV